MRQKSPAAFLIILLLFISASLFGADSRITLYVPFDGSLDAKAARGNPKAQWHGKIPKPEFQEGIKGLGFVYDGNSSLSFAVERNLYRKRGTITFWWRQVEPEFENNKTGRYSYNVMNFSGPNGHTLLYKWEWYGSMTLLTFINYKKPDQETYRINYPYLGDERFKWHFYAIGWENKHVSLFLDGKKVVEDKNYDLPQFAGRFSIGGGGKVPKRIIDEVTIYRNVLSESELKLMYYRTGRFARDNLVSIPRRASQIKVDGKLGQDEWQNAAEVNGLVSKVSGMTAPAETRVNLCYDDSALYLGIESELPQKAREAVHTTVGITGMLRQSIRRRDADLSADDFVQIDIGPKVTEGDLYRFALNGLNTHFDAIVKGGVADKSWNPVWKSASSVDMDGWHIEAMIPFEAIKAPAPKPGDEWGINILRNWRALKSGRETWAWGTRLPGGSRLPFAAGRARFGAEESVAVQLKSVGDLSKGQLDLNADILNASASKRSVKVLLVSDTSEIKEEADLLLGPGERRTFALKKGFENPATSRVVLEVLDKESDKAVFKAPFHLYQRETFGIESFYYPSLDLYKLSLNLGTLRGKPLKTLSVDVRLKEKKTGREMLSKELKKLSGYKENIEIDFSKIPIGTYEVLCRVLSGQKVLADRSISFHKKPLPEWYGNTLGLSGRVPKPFVPIKKEENVLQVWGRKYDFGDKLFPVQIETQGSEILKKPIALVVRLDSGEAASSNDSSGVITWKNATESRLEFEGKQTIGQATVTTSGWFEYDGFFWNKLEIDPGGKAITGVTFQIPVKKEWGELINVYDYGTSGAGKLVRKGNAFSVGRDKWVASPRPFWIGNAVGGIQFMLETFETWHVQDIREAMSATPFEDYALFKAVFVNKPLRPGEKLALEFGFVATPTRPPAPEYRKFNYNAAKINPGYSWYQPGPSGKSDAHIYDPSFASGSIWRQTNDPKNVRMVSGGPYVITSTVHRDAPDALYWVDEWSNRYQGRNPGAEGNSFSVSPAAKSFQDYMAYMYRENYRRSRFVGLYYDASGETQDSNIYHGAGIKIGDEIKPILTMIGTRLITKRLYQMLRDLEPEHTLVIYHASGMFNMAFLSFCDIYADGENFTSILQRNKDRRDYHIVFPPDAFRAQSMGHNFGPTDWLLDEFTRSRAITLEEFKTIGTQPVDHLFGLVLLHDSTYWQAYGVGYDRWHEALKKYRFDKRYEMIPYWNQEIAKMPENTFATFYVDKRAKRVIMIALNNNETDINLSLDLDWNALGYKSTAALRAVDAVHKEPARIGGGKLEFKIGRANSKMIVIGPAGLP